MATSFDLGGLLGSVFGGGGSALEDLLTPEQRAAIQRQSALSAAAALLQASGRSTTPVSLGQALGSAFTAGQTGMQKGTESALTQMLTRQKIDEARRAQDLQKNIAAIFAAGGAGATPAAAGPMTADEALATPGMAAGPTVERAALIGQPRPAAAPGMAPPGMAQPTANERTADRYRQAAQMLFAAGRFDEAAKATDMAEKLAPRNEPIGEPITVLNPQNERVLVQRYKYGPPQPITGFAPTLKAEGQPFTTTDIATGKQVLAQRYEDGTVKALDQFGVPRDMKQVDLNGRIQFVDMNAVQPGSALAKTLAPQVIGGQETGYFMVGGGGGTSAAAPTRAAAAGATPIPGPQAQRQPRAAEAPAPIAAAATPGVTMPTAGPRPIIPGTGKKPPEQFTKAARQLSDLEGALADYKQTLSTTDWVTPKNIPIPFTESGIPLPTGKDTAAVSSRYNALLMGIKNLYELGALTGPDMSIIERQITNPASWAGFLTSKNAMNEQVGVIEDMLKRAKANLEATYGQKPPEAAKTERQPAPAAVREGATSKDRAGRPIIFRGGRWEYQ